MKKIALLTILVFLFIANDAIAGEKILDVTLNGTDNVTVQSGNDVTASVTVNLPASKSWRSTAYKAGDDNNWVCIDTPDHIGNFNGIEQFSIIAPKKIGENKVFFEIFENNDCTDGISFSSALPALSFGFKKIASVEGLYPLLAVCIAIAAFIGIKKIFYGKKRAGK